ncbi:hypothetical protein N9N99_03700 [Gammaproteobacteria bacterium]|nr:hypothetical protein [Gammaproteobacteria bacterium]
MSRYSEPIIEKNFLQHRFISNSCVFGLIAWGAPAAFIYPDELMHIFFGILLSFFIFNFRRPSKVSEDFYKSQFEPKSEKYVIPLIIIFAILYVFIDSIFGTQKLAGNIFINTESVSLAVSSQDNQRGQGRGFWELVAAILIFIPFYLYDLRTRWNTRLRPYIFFTVFVLVFYEIEASRGYIVAAIACFYLSRRGISFFQIIIAGLITISLFFLASIFRGDFNDTSFSNPLFSGIVWPYINLGIYLNADCNDASAYEFLMQAFQKFIPSFIMEKNIISFNLEASECMYNLSLDDLGSVSIFTYMGELFFYKPSLFTSIIAGSILGIATKFFDSFLVIKKFYCLQVFVGLWIIILFRSRVLDVFSYLIALALFLIFINFFKTIYLKYFIPLKKVKI